MNLHRVIIVTTDNRTLGWKSLWPKLQTINDTLNSMKNADFSVEIEYRDYVPQVVNGRITRESFDTISLPYLKAGYDFVLVHMSKAQSTQFGIQPTIRGIAQTVDGDEVAEGYFWADETTKRGKFNQFIETCLHEISHLFCYGAKRLDETHAYHDANGTIVGLFPKYDMMEYQPERFLLKKKLSFLKGLLARLLPKTYPVPQWKKLSQAYGIANNSWYPLTGHHIGTDFPCPIGTPIKAHKDCVVTRSGSLPKSIGYWCEVNYGSYYLVFCHLERQPAQKILLAGEVIGYTGNTGFVKGVHLHVEGWHKPMDRSKLTKETWNQLTFDVTKII